MIRRAKFKFRLFTADETPNSMKARANLTAFCAAYLAGRYEIEVVDVYEEPQRALADGIRMTPTLLKLAPQPVRRIVGTLRQSELVFQVLGLLPDQP